jgi:hypothetical protein
MYHQMITITTRIIQFKVKRSSLENVGMNAEGSVDPPPRVRVCRVAWREIAYVA